jgi:predicted Ser/Thr protein kinase
VSLWKRIFGLEELPDEHENEREPASHRAAGVAEPAPRAATAEEKLVSLGDPHGAAPRPDEVLALFEELRREGREARALDLVRRVLAEHAGLDEVGLAVARALAARGDDAGAAELVAGVVRGADPPLEALMLAAEVAERRGESAEALALYERVLARDLDYAQARERVRRLREEGGPRRDMAGATLLTDGALARGRYRVQRELGRGGAGTVFAAHDEVLDRPVALKVYHRRGRAERPRLLAEAKTPALLEHPGIIRIFDLDPKLGAIAMEWVRGGSIRLELSKGAVPFARVSRWLATALEALSFVHAADVVHRDLKPSNFLLREDDRVVLTDFGLATHAGDASGAAAGQGTLAYMAPEQRGNAPATTAMDVYALGATMEELFSASLGDVPASWRELALACKRGDPRSRPTVAEMVALLL